jgi:hypothetical protein
VELLARIYASPDFTHGHLQRTIASSLALRDPADGSLHSDFSLISISGQVLLIKGRGAILLEPSPAAELQKPSSAPRASSKIHARLDDKENGREVFSEVYIQNPA